MSRNAIATWEEFAIQEKSTKQNKTTTPGISLITEKELDILAKKRLTQKEMGCLLSVKAIFNGTIIQ